MKTMKKLIPALAMLLVSAVLLGTSTFAWFSMNTKVTATGMQVKAVAEGGIVISNSTKSTWTASSTAQNTSAEVIPTTTKAVTPAVWAHAKSDNADDAKQNQAVGNYSDVTLAWSASTEGIGYVDNNANSTYNAGVDTAYVLKNIFYIKSSAEVLTSQDLYINDVTVTGATNKIDAALRVMVVVTDVSDTPKVSVNIFAPVGATAGGSAPTTSYKFKNTDNVTALTGAGMQDVKVIDSGKIGNTDGTAVTVEVYMYFEGEDVNCKSTNISGIVMADLALSIDFGTAAIH